MEAKDLMIGDILKTVYNQKIIKVKEIKQSCIYTEGNGYEYNEIEPIPLTPEILEKNEFVKKEHRWILSDSYTKDKLIVLFNIANGFALLTTEGMTLAFQYVHELQHFYKLCGIKKEIEL